MPTYYNTAQVVAASKALDRFTPWLRNTFFGNVVQFDTEEILFDKLGRRRAIAPFVSPNIPGKERAQRSRSVRAYTPPYVKPKTSISPGDAKARMVGEQYGGAFSQLDRFDQLVMQALADHDEEISGREELMCAQALTTGQVVAVGDGIKDTIAFGRDAALTVALTSTARWGETGVVPLDDLRSWGRLIGQKSGAVARDVVMGYSAAELFMKDADIRAILDNRRQAGGALEMAAGASGGEGDVAAFLGSIGNFRFWEYTQTYVDDAGSTQHFWPAYGVGLIGADMAGTMAYGAIQDHKSLLPEQRFATEYDEFDPSRTIVLTQSAPLPVPVVPDASFFATVR